MEISVVGTVDITHATSLLCRDYILVPADGDVEVVENTEMVSLVGVEIIPAATPGRRPLCRFLLGCQDEALLNEKSEAYASGELYVPPRAFDAAKKQIAAAMAEARTKR